VGIAGHSLGGTVGAIVAAKDSRISAAVNIDGPLFPGLTRDDGPVEVGKPFLFLMTEEHADGPSRGREFAGSESKTFYVEVKGAEHRSFTDSELIRSRFSRRPARDAADFRRARMTTALTDSLVVEFFDKYLRGGEAPHLDSVVSIVTK
jgi:pimeloyl-ACP methyl ester carboxylesterase